MDDAAFARRLSSGYGLIELPMAELKRRLAAFEPPDSHLWSLSQCDDVSAILRHLVPLSHPARRYVFVPMGPLWCAVVDNDREGPDFGDLQNWLGPWDDVLTIRVVDHPGAIISVNGFRERTAWSARILDIRGAGRRRSIVCANDGGRWVFETSGEPMPVEAGFPYEAHPKADRFGSNELTMVLEHLGTRRLTSEDLLSVEQAMILDISDRDPLVQMNMKQFDCTPEQADDPAYGYWRRAATWIQYIDTHAESAVSDLTRAVALNPVYAKPARPHLKRAKTLLGTGAFDEAVRVALSQLETDQ